MSEKICLIDGSGYIFRAFYALPPMTSPSGTPVNAVYGFTNMFFKLTNKIDCDYTLVLFDAKRKNYRNEIYPDYKANRQETPPDLIPQFEIIREAVDTLNLDYLEMEGYEADDLIATYTQKALDEGKKVVIVSADKDLMQLVREGVEFYDPMKDKFFTNEDVKEKFGVYPDRVIDVQALAGDSSDNIPGVPGIGLKTAAELVNQFGSLEEVLNRAEEIKQNKRRETLIENKDKAEISLKLVTLKNDVPVPIQIENFQCRKPELKKLQDFADKYDFKSLRPRIESWVKSRCSSPQITDHKSQITPKYSLVQDESTLRHWVEKITRARAFAFDTETTGLNPTFDDIVGFSMSVEEGEACYVPLKHKTAAVVDLFAQNTNDLKQLPLDIIKKHLRPIFGSKSILKIGHNIKFDIHFMKKVLGEDCEIFPIDDTCVMSYVLDSSEHGHGLDELAELFLNHKNIKYEELTGSGKNKITFAEVPIGKAVDYAAEDADITLRLYNVLKPRLIKEKKVFIYEGIDRPLISILEAMESEGILVDKKLLLELSQDFDKKLKTIEQEVYKLAGEEFNLGSPKQIGEILHVKLGLKGKKTATGAFQTGADVLEQLAGEHELPAKILEWRGFAKLKSTYTDSLLELTDKFGRVHTSFNQTYVNTGRLSSSNPNLQNIPIRTEEGRKIRSAFVAKSGCKILAADYSQVELRLMANVADVKGLKEAFANGIDVHTATAAKVFGVKNEEVTKNMRRDAKVINFGIIYGISQFGLAKQLGTSADEAKKYIDNYFKELPEIRKYMENTINFAKKYGYVLTPMGRKISINGINDQNKRLANFAERAAINAPIQGGAADIVKLAMNAVSRELKEGNYKTKMLLQVHDELVFEVPEEEIEKVSAMVKEKMETIVDYEIPLTADLDTANNWSAAH